MSGSDLAYRDRCVSPAPTPQGSTYRFDCRRRTHIANSPFAIAVSHAVSCGGLVAPLCHRRVCTLDPEVVCSAHRGGVLRSLTRYRIIGVGYCRSHENQRHAASSAIRNQVAGTVARSSSSIACPTSRSPFRGPWAHWSPRGRALRRRAQLLAAAALPLAASLPQPLHCDSPLPHH